MKAVWNPDAQTVSIGPVGEPLDSQEFPEQTALLDKDVFKGSQCI